MKIALDTRRRRAMALLPLALLTLAMGSTAAGCGGGDATGASGGGELAVVGYSTPETVYTEAIEPAFAQSPKGAGVGFSNSFGASGDQSRAVAAGQPAAIVHFSQGGDMERLVEEGGTVAADWNRNEHRGIASNSVVVLVVREGNPEGIESFEDLQSKDVDVVTPNPFSSGSARWNVMAVYGAALDAGGSPAEGLAAVRTVLEKTVAQPGSARDALAAFTQGQGDVLLSYENEAIKAVEEGEDVEYVVPPATIQIETPIAVTAEAPQPAARNFLAFLWSEAGQRIWAENGYRPVDPELVDPKRFPTPEALFTIDEFGGWGRVNEEFFDDENGSVAQIETELGVSTGG